MSGRGAWIRVCAAGVFDARTMERVVDPAIADLRHERFSVSRYLAVLKVVALCLPETSMRLGPACVVAALSALVVVGLLESPFLVPAARFHALDFWIALYILPSTTPMAIAVGLTVITVAAGQRRSSRAAIWIIAFATAAAAISFVNLAWFTPQMNQIARLRLSNLAGFPPPLRGIGELTLGEVRRQLAMAQQPAAVVVPRDLHWLAIRYQGNFAAPCAPLLFTAFGLVAARLRGRVRWPLGIGVCIAYVAYLLYLSLDRLVAVDGPWLGGAAWYPLIVLALLIVMIGATRRFSRTSRPEVSV
jgi:hypothetical protein